MRGKSPPVKADNPHASRTEGVVYADSTGRIVHADRKALELMGLDRMPTTLQEGFATGNGWQTLLEAGARTSWYSGARKIEVTTAPVRVDDRALWQLSLADSVRENSSIPFDDKQVGYVASLARISKLLNDISRIDRFLEAALQEIVKLTGAAWGQIAELDEVGSTLTPRLTLGHSPETLTPTSLTSQLVQDRREVWIADLAAFGGTGSFIATPINISGELAGALMLWSERPTRFDAQGLLFATTSADLLGVALAGAQQAERLEEGKRLLQERAQQVERFVHSSRALLAGRPLDEVYQELVEAVQRSADFRIVGLDLVEQDDPDQILSTVAATGLSADRFSQLGKVRLDWRVIEKMLRPEFNLGAAYFLPREHVLASAALQTYLVSELDEVAHERPTTISFRVAHLPAGETLPVHIQPDLAGAIVGSLPAEATDVVVTGPAWSADRSSWLPVKRGTLEGWVDERFLEAQTTLAVDWYVGDLFVIPLYDSQGQPIGLIRLDSPGDGRRPNINAAKILEVFANQTATAIENARLVEQTLARNRDVRTLFEAGHEVSSSLDQVNILRTMARYLLQIINAQRCTVYAWDRRQKQLVVMLELAAGADIVTRSAGIVYDLSEMEVANEVIETQSARVKQLELREPDDAQASIAGLSGTLAPVAYLPIMIREDIYGVVEVVCSPNRRQVTPNELTLLAAIISQAAIALENAQLFQDTLQRELFFAALGRVTMAISVSVDLPTVLSLICQESLSLFEVDGAYIWHKQEASLVALAGHGYAAQEIVGSVVPLSEKSVFPAAVAELGEGILGNHFRREKTLQLRFPRPSSVEAVLGVPLKIEEEISGVLVLVDTDEPVRFGPEDLERATLFGMQAAIAIRNARMVTELRELNERLDVRVAKRTRALGQERDRVQYLLRVTSELSASLDQHRVLYRALQLINEIVNATHGAILLVDNDTGRLVHPAAYDTHKLPPMPGVDMGPRPEEGLPGWVVKNRQALVIDDITEDDRWTDTGVESDLRSVMALPLISGDEVIGVLMLFHRDPAAFSPHQLELVEAAAMQVASAISNAQLYLLIRDQAERLGKMLREEHVEAAKNQAILESIADGVLVANARGQVVLANMSAAQILDVPRAQLLGKSVNELLGLYGSSGDTWVRAIHRWARSTMAESDRPFLAERLTIEDKVVSVHLSPVFSQGQFFGTVSIFRDVTKEVEVDRMKSEFVSTVSHELRTPMTSIKGYADLMLMGASGPMSPTQSRYLRIIKNNADRMTMLINDVLDISRIESGKTELELQPVSIGQIVDQVITVHLQGRIRHENKAIEIDTNVAPLLPSVKADPTRLTQILTNLLDNAFHYTPAGGRIYVRASADEYFAYVTISDTGIGITKEDQAKIFDRFFRSEDPEVQRVPGTGLGLAIVRSLIEMHGGQIDVDSEPGRGSTFSFSLPLADAEPGASGAP